MNEAAHSAIERRAARVLVLDDADRLLLFQGRDPLYAERGTWWFTPGGGLDAGETSEQAASRELHEETGLRVPPDRLGPVVHERVTRFPWGDELYEQSEQYFLVRVDALTVDTSGFNEVETAAVLGHRWWTRQELQATQDRVYPAELLELLP